ncbi:MAG: isoprenylcysteine carboxylmethyltransferase family protein [Elusimicrobia bacterium]|nr:isoprenylcysteine carboxylmethyltransferase family protein [Elusimicrobiota bacterium]
MPEEMSLKAALFKIFASIILLGGMLFFLGGRFNWPQAWVYMFFYAAWALGTVPWLKKHNPELLRKRLLVTLKAKALWDRIFIEVNLFLYVSMMVTTSLDAGLKRPEVPVYINILAFAGLFAGYALIFYTFKVNKYAIKIVKVVEGQQVVSAGPYAVVRHPMYAAVSLLYLSTPPALGSWYGLIPAALMVLSVLFRAHFEEKTLTKELPGYSEYAQKVKYRLIPGVW